MSQRSLRRHGTRFSLCRPHRAAALSTFIGPGPGAGPAPLAYLSWPGLARTAPGARPDTPPGARPAHRRPPPPCVSWRIPPSPWPPSRGRLAADRPAAATCLSAARPPQLWRLTYALLVGLQPSDRAACLSALAPRQPATPRLHTHAKLPHERLETRDERSCRMRDERLEKLPHERRETT